MSDKGTVRLALVQNREIRQRAEAVRSPAVLRAVRHVVEDAVSVEDAARAAGMSPTLLGKLVKEERAARGLPDPQETRRGKRKGPMNPMPAVPTHPDGQTCSDCAHFRRCHLLLSYTGKETMCDWEPSRFKPTPTPTENR